MSLVDDLDRGFQMFFVCLMWWGRCRFEWGSPIPVCSVMSNPRLWLFGLLFDVVYSWLVSPIPWIFPGRIPILLLGRFVEYRVGLSWWVVSMRILLMLLNNVVLICDAMMTLYW